jgi:hypothetical protein
MANPFENSSQNPFENDAGDGSNPFDDSNHSIDDIEIPGLDDELDVIVSNPFREVNDDSLCGVGGREIEVEKIIENVNLTFRARSDETIISNIKSEYFNLQTFELVSGLLTQITSNPELKCFKNLVTRVAELKAQLKAIERRLAQKIQSNEAAYKKHQNEIESLHSSLIETSLKLKKCRENIKKLKYNTQIPLIILNKNYERRRAQELSETLIYIKTLIELEQTLNGLLSRSEYTEAIKLMENCKKISKKFQKFPCCAQISSRLSDTSKMAINNLDQVLSQQTIKYDKNRFNSLLEGKAKGPGSRSLFSRPFSSYIQAAKWPPIESL